MGKRGTRRMRKKTLRPEAASDRHEGGGAAVGEDMAQVQNNTRRFVDFLTELDLEAVSTRGSVALRNRATCRPPGMRATGPPWVRGRYQQLDYLLVSRRWSNGWGET